MTEEKIRTAAIEFARKNKDRIAKEFTDLARYAADEVPISAFMAGSPGAGKTEFSKNLISLFEKAESIKHGVIRIDGDDFRQQMPGYAGNNSYLFQGAISIIVDRIQDCVLRQRQTFVLDGTFSDYNKAVQNIRRSLDKHRVVFIFYVYQRPEVAWKFTQAREKDEGRNIPKGAFIEAFLGAWDTVNRVRKEFGREVVIFLVKKDFERHTVEDVIDVRENTQIDDYIKERYTQGELEEML